MSICCVIKQKALWPRARTWHAATSKGRDRQPVRIALAGTQNEKGFVILILNVLNSLIIPTAVADLYI